MALFLRSATRSQSILVPSLARLARAPVVGAERQQWRHRNAHSASPSDRAPRWAAAAGAVGAAAAAAALAAPHALLEDGESRPPWETSPARPLQWTSLVRALSVAQSAIPTASGFTAHRRRVQAAAAGDREALAAEGGAGMWQFKLEFPADPGADMFDVFTSLVNAFCGTGAANVSSEELATRTVLHANGGRDFELTITVPRHGGLSRHVMLELMRVEADAAFSATEVAAVMRAYHNSQTGAGVHGAREAEAAHTRGKVPPLSPRSTQDAAALLFPDSADDVAVLRSLPPVGLGGDSGDENVLAAKIKLEGLGAEVYVPDGDLGWDSLAGYAEEKAAIQESVVLPLKHPELYEGIVRATRKRFESVLPRAVLLTGLPGCGKTSAARIIAAEVGVPFVTLRVESVLSKYYGETTRKLAQILEATRELGPCVIFCDEFDSLGSRRDDPQAHEVTRRTLSVLLRFLDGIDGPNQSVLVAATNCLQLLDEALISRFDVTINMELPNASTRASILEQYAQQLSAEERERLSAASAGFSGRELHDACKAAERACAGRAIRAAIASSAKEATPAVQPPVYDDYLKSIQQKARTSIGADRGRVKAGV
jgi:hypothetical protein